MELTQPSVLIRSSHPDDAEALRCLFVNSVRQVCSRDYSKTQINAWVSAADDAAEWASKLTRLSPFVAELRGKIVGYADLQKDGLIDHFFCHADYRGRGVGKTLMNHILDIGCQRGIERYYAEVSISAQSFFKHFGFKVLAEQEVNINGVILNNALMEKVVLN